MVCCVYNRYVKVNIVFVLFLSKTMHTGAASSAQAITNASRTRDH